MKNEFWEGIKHIQLHNSASLSGFGEVVTKPVKMPIYPGRYKNRTVYADITADKKHPKHAH